MLLFWWEGFWFFEKGELSGDFDSFYFWELEASEPD
jgi:hypothetical protein